MVSVVSFLLVLLSTLFGAVGALFLKMGAKNFNLNIFAQIKNWKLIFGAILFVIGMGFFIVVLRTENLALAYPITSLSYVWITILSKKYLGESITWHKWVGILLIVLGVVFVSF